MTLAVKKVAVWSSSGAVSCHYCDSQYGDCWNRHSHVRHYRFRGSALFCTVFNNLSSHLNCVSCYRSEKFPFFYTSSCSINTSLLTILNNRSIKATQACQILATKDLGPTVWRPCLSGVPLLQSGLQGTQGDLQCRFWFLQTSQPWSQTSVCSTMAVIVSRY